jgi:hypothetical protein
MHFLDLQRRTTYPLSSRVFQQTVFNEYGGESLHWELNSLYARGERWWRRNPTWRLTWDQLSDSALFHSFGVSEPEDVERIAHSAAHRLAIEKDMKLKPRLSSRFHGVSPVLLSGIVAGLLSPASVSVTDIWRRHSADEARDLALRLAAWMGTPVSARTEAPPVDVKELVGERTTEEETQHERETD